MDNSSEEHTKHAYTSEDGHHHHSHDSSTEASHRECKLTKTQSIIFMLILTSSFFLVELIVGHVTKSNALVADAFHMLSDIISLVIGLVAVRMSKMTSARNTFGWVRAEVLGSLVNSVFLLALCFSIVIEAINRFIEPEKLEKVDLMLIVGGVGLVINLVGLLIFGMHGHAHGHSHKISSETNDKELEITVVKPVENKYEKKKKPARNMNIQGVFLHVLSDALGSVAVIISGLIVKYGPGDSSVKWKLYVDPTLSLLITVLITVSAIPLLRDASLVLLQTVPSQFNIEDLKGNVKKIKGILDVHHFHVWSLNSEKLIASAHLRIRKQSTVSEFGVLQEVKRLLHKNEIHATTIQLEYDLDNASFSENNYDLCDGIDCSKKQCCRLVNNEEEAKF